MLETTLTPLQADAVRLVVIGRVRKFKLVTYFVLTSDDTLRTAEVCNVAVLCSLWSTLSGSLPQ